MIKQYNCTGIAGNHHHPLILYTDMSKAVLSHLLVFRCKSGDIVGHLARQGLRRSEASKLSKYRLTPQEDDCRCELSHFLFLYHPILLSMT